MVSGMRVSTTKSKSGVMRTFVRTKMEDGSKSRSTMRRESGWVTSKATVVVSNSGKSSLSAASGGRCGRMKPGGSLISTGKPRMCTSSLLSGV
jgi:hypothetical protein